jgi:hypothetical protein
MLELTRITNNPASGAFYRLKGLQDMLLIKEYLKENLAQADSDNRSLKDVDLYRSQGKALTLKAILDLLDSSKEF